MNDHNSRGLVWKSLTSKKTPLKIKSLEKNYKSKEEETKLMNYEKVLSSLFIIKI